MRVCIQSLFIVKCYLETLRLFALCHTLLRISKASSCENCKKNKVEMFVAAKSGASVNCLRSLTLRDMTCIVYGDFHFTD